MKGIFSFKSLPIVLTFLYFAGVTLLFWKHGTWIRPDTFLWILLLLMLILGGRLTDVLKEWLPFVFILFSYEYLRGMVPQLLERVNSTNIISWEQRIFGFIPTLRLQEALFSGTTQWYDTFFTGVYFLHFIAPLVFAFLLWRKSREWYRRFAVGLISLSYLAFVTYYVFPAMPPWLAAKEGHLPEVVRIQKQVYAKMPANEHFEAIDKTSIFRYAGPNDIAAIPSLHAAYPFLILLFALSYFGKKGLLALPYALAVWFGVVYLGEHYVVDVLLGIAYAGLVFLVVRYFSQARTLTSKLLGVSLHEE